MLFHLFEVYCANCPVEIARSLITIDLCFCLEFANQLVDYSTAYEHRQYIGLLEKLQQFVKK